MIHHSPDRQPPESSRPRSGVFYDSGTIKVVVFACVIIVLSVVLTGSLSYVISRNAVVDKLQSHDLPILVESIAAKVDGRISRAEETALLLAKDPAILQWVKGAERDERLGEYAKTKLDDIAQNYDYANSFIVSAVTKHYWAEGFKLIQTVSPANPGSKWFYDALKSGRAVQLNLDYDIARRDTFVFVNALVGDLDDPVAVAGVGLSLQDISREFQRFKLGEDSRLWLIDRNGKIYLSDNLADNGRQLQDLIPSQVASQVAAANMPPASTAKIIEYTDAAGNAIDLAYQATKSADWKLVFQIPRRESIGLLDSIRHYTAVAGLIALVVMVFIFYLVSRRIADPLKRALLLAGEMEHQVQARTRELSETNQKILDSIHYAKRLQESILAKPAELQSMFKDYFILWAPRDIVGGDFYWVRRLDCDSFFVAAADCTGHGVPGAFMTMAVNSALNHIVDQGRTDPADVLAELHHEIKATLHRNDTEELTDDGLDIAICRIDSNRRLVFAGAKISLYICRENQVTQIKADNKSIGYRRSPDDLALTAHSWPIQTGDQFYLSTDGYLDQNGGEKDFPFGRSRLLQLIAEQSSREMARQKQAFAAKLREYQGGEAQRDDITLIGFTIK